MTKTKTFLTLKKLGAQLSLWRKQERKTKLSILAVLALVGGGIIALQNPVLASGRTSSESRVETRSTPESCFDFDSRNGSITGYKIGSSRECGTDVIIPERIGRVEVKNIGNYSFYSKQLTSVTLPNSLTSIGENAFSYNKLKSVVIPDSVRIISNGAFRNNNEIVSVEIGNSVTTIENYAFAYNKIRKVNLPNSVVTIGSRSFINNEIDAINIPDSVTAVGGYAFSNNLLTSAKIGNGVTSIAESAFANNKLSILELGNSITTIERGAFENNELSTLKIPDSVITVGNEAFKGNKLSSVKIGNGTTSIGRGAFQNNQLSTVNLGNALTTIGFDAFLNNKVSPVWGIRENDNVGLTIASTANIVVTNPYSRCFNFDKTNGTIVGYRTIFPECGNGVTIPDTIGGVKVTNIGPYSFQSSNLVAVHIPSSVTTIERSAFQNNQISDLRLGSGITTIGEAAFHNNKLDSLELPKSLVSLGNYAFSYNQLTGLLMPDSIKSIGNFAFISNKSSPVIGRRTEGRFGVTVADNSNMKLRKSIERCFEFDTNTREITKYYKGSFPECTESINIPGTIDDVPVISIGEYAFMWQKMKAITIPSLVVNIGRAAFEMNQLTSVIIPNSVKTIGPLAFGSNQLTGVTIGDKVSSIGHSAFYKNQLTSVNIPDSVTTIGYGAFSENRLSSVKLSRALSILENEVFAWNNLETISIPDSVKSIGESVFIENRLREVKLGNGVTTIGKKAFEKNQIEKLTFPNSLISIGENTFLGNQLSSIQFGNAIQNIGFGAFAENKLSNLDLPNSLTNLGQGAFAVNELKQLKLSENLTTIEPRTFAWNNLTGTVISQKMQNVAEYAFFGNKKVDILNQLVNILEFNNWWFPDELSNREKLYNILSELGYEKWKSMERGAVAKNTPLKEEKKSNTLRREVVNGFFGAYAQNYDIFSEFSRLSANYQTPVLLQTEQDPSQVRIDPTANAEIKQAFRPTPEKCFEFDRTSGTITKYLKGSDPVCTDKVIIPDTIGGVKVLKIGDKSFYSMGITLVVFPDDLKEIGSQSFHNNSLKQVSIPGSVDRIDYWAFVGNKMESLTLSGGIKRIEATAFYNNKLTSLSIPSSVSFIGGAAFNRNQLPDDQAFVYARKADGSEDKTTLVSYGGAKRADVQIPNTIKILDTNAFFANNITSVQVPSGVTTIRTRAFDLNSLTGIILPETVKTIGSRAFFRNSTLKQAQLLSPTATLEACAFGCLQNSSGTLTKNNVILWKTNGVSGLILSAEDTHIQVNPLLLKIKFEDDGHSVITGEKTFMGQNKTNFDGRSVATANQWFEAGKTYTITPTPIAGYDAPAAQQVTFMTSPNRDNYMKEIVFVYTKSDIADHFCDYRKTALENPNISNAECKALLDIYNTTQGSGWKTSFGWKSAALNKKDQFEWKICKWTGISCTDGKLSAIDLSDNNLKGSLANSFRALINLKSFKAGKNQLSKSLSKINNPTLTVLVLENNPLNEDFSSWSINAHSQLQELKLNATQIIGTLPDSLPLSLRTLELANNRLNGTLPSGIGNLNQLKTLDLSNNFFVENFSSKINRKFNQLENFKIDRNYIANLDTAGSYLGFLDQNPQIKTKNPDNIKQYKISFQDKRGNQISTISDLTLGEEREVVISRLLSLGGNRFTRENLSESELTLSFDNSQIQVNSSAFPLLKVKTIGDTSALLNTKIKGSSWGEWTNAKLSLIKNNEDPNNPDNPGLWTGGVQTATGFLDNGLNFELGGKYLDQFFSFVHFNVAGNDFGGGFFWLPVEKLTNPVTIKTRNKNGEEEVKICHNKVRGFYYNSQRGERLWPLDDASRLALKKYSATTYASLGLRGGWYTSCIGSNGVGTNQEDSHGIYGSIEHSYQGNTMKLNAGIAYDTANNKMKTDGFRCNFMRLNNSYPFGYIYDDYGHIGFVGAMITSGAMNNSSSVNNFHNGLNGLLDNGACINDIFGYNGVEISYTADPNLQIPGINSWNDLISFLLINPGSTKETLFNLGIRGIVGLTSDLASESKKYIESNTFDSTLLLKTDESIAKALNLVNKNAEKLCRGKWQSSQMSIATDSEIICVKGENENSSVSFRAENLAGKTLVAKETNVKLTSFQENNSNPINLFIDKGNLVLPSSVHTGSLAKFDAFGYAVNAPGTGYAMANYLKGNFIINGLLIGYDNSNQSSTIKNKLYIHGKVLSFNTFGNASQQRINALQKLLGDGLRGADTKFIPINELFTWSCILGVGSDGTWCKGISQQEAGNQSQSLLVDKAFGLIDMSFPTKLLE